MKFTREKSEGHYTVHAYRDGEAVLNALPGDEGRDEDGRITLRWSFLITPEKVLREWPVSEISQLDGSLLSRLNDFELEVLLIGTGENLHFPSAEQLASLTGLGIGYEVMSSAAACRTYNVLVSEGRKVGAIILLEQTEG